MSEYQRGHVNESLKRKKKRSSNQIAKKIARRNCVGQFDSGIYEYIVQVNELIKSEFSSIENKLLFANNVYKQTKGYEVDCARNQIGSRVFEFLMPFVNLKTIQRLLETFKDYLRPMCSDRFASHVLQKLIRVCIVRANRDTSIELKNAKFIDIDSGFGKKDLNSISENSESVEIKNEDKGKYKEISLKLCRYVINNMEEFIWDTYANHILRTVIECLGGFIDESVEQNKRKSGPSLESRRKVDQIFLGLLIDTCKRIHKLPQFIEFGHNEITSGFLQSVLYSLKDIDSDLCTNIIKRIINNYISPGMEATRISFLHSESSSRLMETCLVVSEPKIFSIIYKEFFATNLVKLSLMRNANFCVQRLFDYCVTKEIFEEIFQEISEDCQVILQSGNTGVLYSLANACLRLRAKQGSFINCLSKTLHFEEAERQKDMVRLIACLVTYENWQEAKKKKRVLPLTLHGSLIVQAMLNFNKPIKIVNSLLESESEDLVLMFVNNKGSRILDAFMNSEFIGEKSREKLMKKLQGYWVQLANDVYGSRCLEKIWTKAKHSQKMIIMEELARIGESLKSSKPGRVISAKLNVSLFLRNRREWMEAQGRFDKAKILFADIIAPDIKKRV